MLVKEVDVLVLKAELEELASQLKRKREIRNFWRSVGIDKVVIL